MKSSKILVATGIIATVLLVSTAGLLYWQGYSIKSASQKIQCPDSGGGITPDGVILEADLSCSTSVWQKQRSGEDLEELALVLAIAGVALGFGATWIAHRKNPKKI